MIAIRPKKVAFLKVFLADSLTSHVVHCFDPSLPDQHAYDIKNGALYVCDDPGGSVGTIYAAGQWIRIEPERER